MRRSTPVSEDEANTTSRPAGSSRKSRRQESLAKLPVFDFSPGEPADSKARVSTPPDSPLKSAPTTPKSTRHRRTESEFVGGDAALPSIPPVPVPEIHGPKPGHRHRRSGAVSQDLTAIHARASNEQLLPHVKMPFAIPEVARPDVSDLVVHRSSPTRQTFSTDISDHGSVNGSDRMPRSAFLQPLDYTTNAIRSHSSESFTRKRRKIDMMPQRPPLPKRPASSPVLSESERVCDKDNNYVPKEGEDLDCIVDMPDPAADLAAEPGDLSAADLDLSVDFDDDPTASIVSTAPQSPCLLPRGPPSPSLGEVESAELVIDLDEAIEDNTVSDMKSAKGKSFSSARRSMHSGQPSGGFSLPGMQHYHRRAESAPQLVPVAFSRPEIHRFATTASEKGFTMTDVFEEDEDEIRSKRSSMTRILTKDRPMDGFGFDTEVLGAEYAKSTTLNDRSSPTLTATENFEGDRQSLDSSSHETPRASRLHTPTLGFSHSRDMVTVVDSETTSTDDQPSHCPSLEAMKGRETHSLLPLPILKTSAMNSGFFTESSLSTPIDSEHASNSVSTFSTPRLDTGASSFTSRKVSAATSTIDSDDGKLSGASRQRRRGSSALRYLPRRRSPKSANANATANRQSGSALSFASHSDDKSSKRASIASLSQLIGRSFGDKSRGSSMVEPDTRCKTSDGLGLGSVAVQQQQVKDNKKKRLTKLFKFWKAGDATPSAA
ncbi:MAG: hypothetical protein M1828_001899 [Chrysothrix sp. TS-e1954]|nr:MAG: hypothetical protein M1828_001899 [Chrysothrix sp. TS-e1954]